MISNTTRQRMISLAKMFQQFVWGPLTTTKISHGTPLGHSNIISHMFQAQSNFSSEVSRVEINLFVIKMIAQMISRRSVTKKFLEFGFPVPKAGKHTSGFLKESIDSWVQYLLWVFFTHVYSFEDCFLLYVYKKSRFGFLKQKKFYGDGKTSADGLENVFASNLKKINLRPSWVPCWVWSCLIWIAMNEMFSSSKCQNILVAIFPHKSPVSLGGLRLFIGMKLKFLLHFIASCVLLQCQSMPCLCKNSSVSFINIFVSLLLLKTYILTRSHYMPITLV